MLNVVARAILCAALAVPAVHAETFVIEAEKPGHEATIKIPVGAVTQLSANSAQSLVGYAGPQVEAMRLSGDVLISIAGKEQPIQIKADNVVLELTADFLPGKETSSRSDAAPNKLVRTAPDSGEDVSQIFIGHVVFNLQTSSGPMEIKADRVEHQLGRG